MEDSVDLDTIALDDLHQLVHELAKECTDIETQLEFTGLDDEEWRRRAASALARKRRELKDAQHTLRRRTGRIASDADIVQVQVARATAKMTKAEARLASETRAAEKQRRDRLVLVERLSFAAAFKRHAKRMLDEATYLAICDAASGEVGNIEAAEVATASKD